jgi:putative membrane protein
MCGDRLATVPRNGASVMPAYTDRTVRQRLVVPVVVLVGAVVVLLLGVLAFGRPIDGPVSAISRLPTVNALLNAASAVCLALGFAFIARRKIRAHLTSMTTALGISVVFLISYVTYHAQAGSRPFAGHGWTRAVYFPLLISHVVLAAVIVPLAVVTVYRAWRGELSRHRTIARWTLPIWLYVSVTGVVVYVMLYHAR